ncbi:hypothetical protein D6817_04005 [Candidatus Pacearchaeota archaeon]|nr:MAG: hypothetical protein D6817_04005 [Candidatus Pacearchaeota archaeon]
MKKRVIVTYAVLALVFLVVALKFTFFAVKDCGSFECFQDSLKRCERARYVNDAVEASWEYETIGREGGACKVNVRFLQPKEGELALQKLSGLEMVCYIPLGVGDYPEKDLNKCTGKLKEEMQAIIIKRLHTYILQNLGEIDESLRLLS